MDENRPRGRQRKVTGEGKEIKRRGPGLGTGPVGKRDDSLRNPNQGRESSKDKES
ncbi:MAG: hypothetical protein IKM28_06755 [Lachnospiraceae bacterium]|nr:hypothetical protein [Lachnospiraceae bacterium]